MTRKIIAAVSAAAVVASMGSISAFAVDYPGGKQNTKITTSIDPTFTVSIPADTTVAFNAETTDFSEVKLVSAQIDPGKAVKVELDASGTLKNAEDDTKTIAYVVNEKEAGTQYVSGQYKAAGDATALKIDITKAAWDAAFAGSYSDTVTFTVSYVDAD